jgi:hypothetical protein
VKHLLIILSILLLSSPVIGQETGVLYLYETSTGIQWKTFGDGKVQPMYKGEIKNGIMDGLGVLIYPYGEKSVVGEWKNGKEWNTKHRNKEGTLIGKFESGKWILKWGYLKYRYLKKKKENEWYEVSEDEPFKYVGEIENGKPHGYGTLISNIGFKTVGIWKYGDLWNVKQYDNHGELWNEYVNGKEVKQ